MHYLSLIQAIKQETETEPKQADLCKILDATRQSMSRRQQRNSKFSDEEIEKIENFYAIKLDRGIAVNDVELDYYENVFGSCGVGNMVFDESKTKLSITKATIKDYSSNNKYSVINAVGSSMSPAINDDDKVIIKHYGGEQIKDHRVYLFRYNDELFIKRLVKNIDQIVCISENKEFENRTITDLKSFNVIGEVVGLIREKV